MIIDVRGNEAAVEGAMLKKTPMTLDIRKVLNQLQIPEDKCPPDILHMLRSNGTWKS